MLEIYADSSNCLETAAFTQKLIGHLQAVQLTQLASYAQAHEHDPFAHLEIAARLSISDRAAQDRLRSLRS